MSTTNDEVKWNKWGDGETNPDLKKYIELLIQYNNQTKEILEDTKELTYEWESVMTGQNPEIQKIVSAATKASQLLNTNIGLAKSGLQLAQSFLLGVLNQKILLLNAIADEIDNFVNDFRGTGFFVLEVTPNGKALIPTDADGNPIKLLLSRKIAAIATSYASAMRLVKPQNFYLGRKKN